MPRRIIFPARGRVELQAFEVPEPAPEEIRVRTLYSLISIGTETTILHQRYAADSHFARRFSFPQLKTGVLSVGRVERAGSKECSFTAGDPVFYRMAHGSHQVLPASACSAVPAGIDLKAACWCGLAKTAYRAAWAGRFDRAGEVLVIGAGPVGQMALRWARTLGTGTIAVADLSAERLQHARRGGANVLMHGEISQLSPQVAALNGGQGPALIVDTTGNPAVFRHALAAAARFGHVILLGDTGYPERQCLAADVMTKGLTIQAVHESHDRDGWTQDRVDRLFFDSVQNGRFDLSGLITHEFNPRQCEQAYALADLQRDQVMGVMFDWTGGEY